MTRFELEDKEKIIILVIISVFSVLIALSFAGLAPFTLANNDLDNARGILADVGVQGLSAIFAIVISLTLMAVQFASQQYTHRIMDIHIKSLIFWTVIVVYLGSLFYNILMLGRLEAPVERRYVEVSMLLTGLSFTLLIPYFFITMVRLKPESVISKHLVKIDADYLNSIKGFFKGEERRIPGEADKMLSVTEIIEKSIGNGDRGTARFGIDEIYKRYMGHLNKENEAYVSSYFLGHILGIGREAIIEADDDSMVQVLDIFGKVGTYTLAQKMDYAPKMALENIDIIGFKVLKDYDVATQQMINSVQAMLRELINMDGENEKILTQIFTLYHDASDALFTLKKYRMIKYLLNSFSELTDVMIEKKQCDIVERTTSLLEMIGVYAVNLDTRDIIHQSIHSLHTIGISAAKHKLIWETLKGTISIPERIIDHLLKICLLYTSDAADE